MLVQNDAGLQYHYNVTSNLLVSIKRTADNAEITVSHNQATSLPERFTTSSGDSMTVKYDSVGKLRSTYTIIADHAILR